MIMARTAHTPGLINIEPFIPALLKYFANNNDITAAYLYGSYGTGAQTPLSDVDLGILLTQGVKRTLIKQMEIESDIAGICRNDDINVLILNDGPVLLQFKVISTGRLLYERDPHTVNNFQEIVCKRYADFMPDYLEFCREYDRALREDYLDG
jgi:predicted nucleotidyltransferase